MQDVSLVSKVDGLRDRLKIGGGALRRQWSLLHYGGQAAASNILHGEEMLAVVEADFVDGDDMRVLEAGGRRRFDAEALDSVGTRQRAVRQHLHCDDAAEADLPRPI